MKDVVVPLHDRTRRPVRADRATVRARVERGPFHGFVKDDVDGVEIGSNAYSLVGRVCRENLWLRWTKRDVEEHYTADYDESTQQKSGLHRHPPQEIEAAQPSVVSENVSLETSLNSSIFD